MKNKIVHDISSGVVTMTTGNLTFFRNLHDISQFCESYLISSDSEVAKLQKIKLSIECYSQFPFAAQSLILQTAGTLTSQAITTNRNTNSVVDLCCNDVVGFEPLTAPKLSNLRISYHDGDNAFNWHILRFEITFSPKVLNLLTKEMTTERLQSLSAGVVIQGSVAQSVSYAFGISYEYKNFTKQLSIR